MLNELSEDERVGESERRLGFPFMTGELLFVCPLIPFAVGLDKVEFDECEVPARVVRRGELTLLRVAYFCMPGEFESDVPRTCATNVSNGCIMRE